MQLRSTVIVVLSSIGLGLIGIHTSGNLWPALPFTIAAGAITLTIVSYYLGPSTAWLFGACGLLFAHASIALLYPETLSNMDPDGYAVWINQVVNSGDLSQANTNSYTSLPVFLLLISTVSEVTNLAPRNAFVAIPILTSAIIPLITAWFTTLLTGCRSHEWPAVPAALLSSVLTMTIAFSYIPIAMVAGYLLLFSAFIVSIRIYLQQNKADILAFVVLGFGVTLSHRLIILLLILAVVMQSAVLVTLKRSRGVLNYITIPAIAVSFLIIQWVYLTTGVTTTIYQTLFISEGALEIDVAEGLQTSASKPVIESRILGIISRRAHGIVLIPIAGISWLYFAGVELTRMRRRVLLSLATAAVLGAFLPLSIAFPGTLNFTRTIVSAEPILVSLAVGCGWLLWRELKSRPDSVTQVGRTILLFVAVMVIVAQVGSAPISADHPAGYRGYLEGDEVSGKMWGHQYGRASISADPFFAHERVSPEAHVDSEGEIKAKYGRYRSMLEPYTDQAIIESCPETVAYREIKVYRSPRSQVLQWDPEATLDSQYTRHYDNSRVQFYTNPRC